MMKIQEYHMFLEGGREKSPFQNRHREFSITKDYTSKQKALPVPYPI
jgi:hypothetical protein